MAFIKNMCETHAPRPHDESICHGTGEQRIQIIKDIKRLLEGCDNRKCVLPDIPVKKKPRQVVLSSQENKCLTPLITNTGLTEIRMTCEPERVADDPPDLYFRPAPNLKQLSSPLNTPGRKKSVELKGGEFYTTCFCLKRNGLQGDCPRSDCLGRPECLAMNPGPCCEPALAHYQKRLPRQPSFNAHNNGHGVNTCCCCHNGRT